MVTFIYSRWLFVYYLLVHREPANVCEHYLNFVYFWKIIYMYYFAYQGQVAYH